MVALPMGAKPMHPGEVPGVKGDRRRLGRVRKQSYDPIVPRKVGNRRATWRWRPRDPLEGRGEQAGVLVDRNMEVHRD
jgi:hypothetical protein